MPRLRDQKSGTLGNPGDCSQTGAVPAGAGGKFGAEIKQEESREVPWVLLVERGQKALREGFVGVQCDLSDAQIPSQPTETPPGFA